MALELIQTQSYVELINCDYYNITFAETITNIVFNLLESQYANLIVFKNIVKFIMYLGSVWIELILLKLKTEN